MSVKQKKDKFIKLLGENLGNISATCIQTGIARKTYYNWINKDDKFKSKVDEILEAQIDYVENKLMEKIEAGDLTAIIFYLKTKAKHRGWSEKIELSHNNQAPVINIVGV